ncbi:MAG: GNAT family N-acetyltransferase [Deltaproteobacteria bacterium]|nr:GNAT family N-acetyltransferase [Deltaproteobacteria bacterium]
MESCAVTTVAVLNPATADALMEIWESSVRATHAFVGPQQREALRPLVREALESLTLYTASEEGAGPDGFAGVDGEILHMLFVRPEKRGRGLGRALLLHAVDRGVRRVDVNEHNPQAFAFYQRMGFVVISRSNLDGQGNPFPLLHMRLPA